jgi:hypothetical protein
MRINVSPSGQRRSRVLNRRRRALGMCGCSTIPDGAEADAWAQRAAEHVATFAPKAKRN